MADVWYKTGQFSTPASGTTVITVTDKGTNPKGIHLWWSKVTANDTVTANQFFGHGFSDGTTHRAFMTNAQDGANNNRRDNENTGAILIDNVTDTRTVVGGAVAMNANDVTIAYSVFAANHIIHYEIWGGADCAADVEEMAASTSPDTAGSFTSDLILVCCTGNTIENASQHSFMSFGAAHDNGTSIDQWVQLTYMGDNDTDVVGSALSTGLIAGQYNSDYTNWTATVTAIGATGFTWSGSNADEWAALKLDLGGIGVDVGTFTKATGAAPATQAMPDLGFTPQGYTLASCDYTSTTIPPDETNRLVHASMGAYDGTTQTSALAVGTASSNADRASQSHNSEVLQGSAALQASGVQWSGTAQSITDATPDIEWNPNTANAVQIGYYALELQVSGVEITTNAPQALAISEKTATISHPVDIATNAPQALAISEKTATITFDVNVTTTAPQALSISEKTATILHPVVITTGTPQALAISEKTATITHPVVITTGSPQALVIAEKTASISYDANITTGSPQALVISEKTATITHPVTITTGSPQALVLTEQTATLTHNVNITTGSPDALLIAEKTATITHDVNITTGSPQALVIAELTASITYDAGSTSAKPPSGMALMGMGT